MRRGISCLILALLIAGACRAEQDQPSRCDLCAGPLGSRYWYDEMDGTCFCETCVRTKPKCFACGKPVGKDGVKVKGQVLCSKCASERPRCADCGEPILQKFYEIEGLQEKFCDRCYKTHPHCKLCGRPFSRGESKMAAGDSMCPRCRAEAVSDLREIERVVARIERFLEDELGMRIDPRIEIRLAGDLEHLGPVSQNKSFRELGAFIQEGNRSEIVILENLPRPMLFETVAHELTHAWQAEHAVTGQQIKIKEGFAQWVAGKVLQKNGFEASLDSLRKRKDLYGEGYRLMERIEKRSGPQGVLRYARETR